MALKLLFLTSIVLVAVTGRTINLEFGNGIKKAAPTPYLGSAGLTPFLGLNPYTRSIGPTINLDFGLGVKKKVPSAYVGANGLLLPFIGINPYLRSIGRFSAYGAPAPPSPPLAYPSPPLGLFQQQQSLLSPWMRGHFNGEYFY